MEKRGSSIDPLETRMQQRTGIETISVLLLVSSNVLTISQVTFRVCEAFTKYPEPRQSKGVFLQFESESENPPFITLVFENVEARWPDFKHDLTIYPLAFIQNPIFETMQQ